MLQADDPRHPRWRAWLDTALAALGEPAADANDEGVIKDIVSALQLRLAGQLPQASPAYAAHMSKPPHGLAWLAQALSATLQPNNHNRDAGAACTEMELEAIAALGSLVGWPQAVGHLCSGGTVANLEALWVARELGRERRTVLASEHAHYVHARNAQLLALPFETVPADACGRLDLDALALRLRAGDVGTVIATLGSTALGAVDPLPGLLRLRAQHGFRLHVDAAYGGYHGLVEGLDTATRAAFDALPAVDSVVIDPHKHGLQPLGCAAVLYPDAAVRQVFQHEAPYCYFDDLPAAPHLGQLGLECSRAGATAAALWATLQLLPLVKGGRFAQGLSRGHGVAQAWHARVRADAGWRAGPAPALDIVSWLPAAASESAASARAVKIRQQAERLGLYLATVRLPARCFGLAATQPVTALRATWMKPISEAELAGAWAVLKAAEAA